MNEIMVKEGNVCSPKGFRASGVCAGFKRSGALDTAMICSDRPCRIAAAFTSNLFCAAPVIYDRGIVSHGGDVRAVLVNSGNANACTGEQGLADARESARIVSELLSVKPEEVLVSSTGRIGVPMPMATLRKGAELAAGALSYTGGEDASRAIMTTDTVPKAFSVELELGGCLVTLGGMTKGAGMIAPKMRPCPRQATMLAYVTTDACISRAALDAALAQALDRSFNRITVDGDTSTNDTFVVLANGMAGNEEIQAGTPEAARFAEALAALAGRLAKEMVKDGEGVSRFVEVRVTGAKSDADARICAESIAKSPLCKTAWFGADPNWGRILCAAGYSGISFDPAKVNLDMQGIPVVRGGMDANVMSEAELSKAVAADEVLVELNLGCGDGAFTVWSCDLTYEYVKINADYHT